MERLILVRHTEKADGQDPPLTDQGRTQATRVAAFISRYKIDLVLCSAFLRAQQTAAILNQQIQAPLHSSAALNEYQLRDDGGGVETADQAIARSVNFINQYRPYYPTILVVGHNSMNRTIAWSLCNLTWPALEALPNAYGATMVIEYLEKTGWTIVATADGNEGPTGRGATTA